MAYYRNQGEINEDSHRANMDAARRRIERNALRAITDPGRFNPWERRALQNYAQETDLLGREDKLREHEKDMVDRKGAIEKDVAKINADKDVAIGKLRFGFEDEKGVRHEGSDVLTERERRLGAEKLGQLQFGSYDENGNYKPGSSVLTEREKGIATKNLSEQQGKDSLALEQQRGKNAVQLQTEANKGLIAQNELKQQQQQAQIAAKLNQAAIQSQGKIDAAKIGAYSKEISAAITAGAMQGKDTATVLAELRATHKDDQGFGAALDSIGGGQQSASQEKLNQRYAGDIRKAKLQRERAIRDEMNELRKQHRGTSEEDLRAMAEKSLGFDNQQRQGGKKAVKRQRNPTTGEIRIVYDDGSTEIVKG